MRRLWNYYCQYLYMPRLANFGVLAAAISSGVALTTWNPETFAFAQAYDPDQDRYLGLQTGQNVTVGESHTALLVHPDRAHRQILEDAPPGRGRTQGGPTKGPSAEAPPREVKTAAQQTPTTPWPISGIPAPHPLHTPARNSTCSGALRDMGDILAEITKHLDTPDSRVTLTLEINAGLPRLLPHHHPNNIRKRPPTSASKTSRSRSKAESSDVSGEFGSPSNERRGLPQVRYCNLHPRRGGPLLLIPTQMCQLFVGLGQVDVVSVGERGDGSLLGFPECFGRLLVVTMRLNLLTGSLYLLTSKLSQVRRPATRNSHTLPHSTRKTGLSQCAPCNKPSLFETRHFAPKTWVRSLHPPKASPSLPNHPICIAFSHKLRPMADNSAIEWTDATWNPVTGCSQTSPGCDNCYALTLAKRLKAMGNPRYQVDGDPASKRSWVRHPTPQRPAGRSPKVETAAQDIRKLNE